MAKAIRNNAWLDELTKCIDETGPRVVTLAEITDIMAEHVSTAGIPRSAKASSVASMLVALGALSEIDLRRQGAQRGRASKKILVWGQVSAYKIAASLRNGSYLSHASALFLHGLLDREPNVIYANKEQAGKGKGGGTLSQQAIDRAFRGRPRESKYAFVWDKHKAVLLSGKNTGRLGVQEVRFGESEVLESTSLERTMVDIAVRPSYSGGAKGVLEAYRAAKGLVTVGGVAEMLSALQYTYPYHQSIGFLLERAGYPESDLRYLEEKPMEWNFYVDYGERDLEFSERWRVYYPEGI